jgi:hypothetical protein
MRVVHTHMSYVMSMRAHAHDMRHEHVLCRNAKSSPNIRAGDIYTDGVADIRRWYQRVLACAARATCVCCG